MLQGFVLLGSSGPLEMVTFHVLFGVLGAGKWRDEALHLRPETVGSGLVVAGVVDENPPHDRVRDCYRQTERLADGMLLLVVRTTGSTACCCCYPRR